jgi:folate-dependent phosphoribosylglycinamide formyltransferase PurN
MKKSDSSSATSTIILISGYGTNLQAILDQTINNQLPIKIISVLSDNPKSYGIERANRSDIPTKISFVYVIMVIDDFCWNV